MKHNDISSKYYTRVYTLGRRFNDRDILGEYDRRAFQTFKTTSRGQNIILPFKERAL